MNYSTQIFHYDLGAFPFHYLVNEHFSYPLCLLHGLPEAKDIARLEVGKDQQTPFHKKFYEIGSVFWDLYRRFIAEVIVPNFGSSKVVFQRRPTFRIHLPGNVATGGWHRDSDYNHPKEEINFVLPLTTFLAPGGGNAGNGFFIESGPGFWYTPSMAPGDFLRFCGSTLTHGSVENLTGLTRVSLDFRLLPIKALADASKASTINQKIPFTVGPDGYYETLPI